MRPNVGLAQLRAHVKTTMGWPPCWHGLCNVNVKLGLTLGKVGHHLAQKFVELGGGFFKGQRCYCGNNVSVGCS